MKKTSTDKIRKLIQKKIDDNFGRSAAAYVRSVEGGHEANLHKFMKGADKLPDVFAKDMGITHELVRQHIYYM